MKKIWLLCIVALLLGCTSNTSKKGLTAEEYKELVYQTIFVIPDSLKTKEQLQLTLKVYDLLHRHVYVEDNCFILPVAKDSFEKEGIPTFYYDVLKYQLNDQNECIKRWLEEGDIPAEQLDQERGFKEYSVRYKEVDRPELVKLIESK